MADSVSSLRAWRYSSKTRQLVAGGLLVTAVATAVIGQSVLTGFVGLGVLMLSAATLSAAIGYLMLDFQGTLSMTTLTLLLPGGQDIPMKRVLEARADGHHLVLDLEAPSETRRVPTHQPPDQVAAFAQAVMQARCEPQD